MIRNRAHLLAMVLAGAFLLSGSAVQAAPTASTDGTTKSADAVKNTSHRHHARHRSQKSDDRREKVATKQAKPAGSGSGDADAAVDNGTRESAAIPAVVADAKAEYAAADQPATATAPVPSRADNTTIQAAADQPAGSQSSRSDGVAVASDQASTQAIQPQSASASSANADVPPRPSPVIASAGSENSAWDQSSLVGKIFIGVGALLTLASAARMFMA
jgi:hypothetical protein